MANQEIRYDNIIRTLIETFGNVLSRDCMFSIVDSCEGNLETSANAILSIMDENLPSTTITESTDNILNENVTTNVDSNQQNIPSCNMTNEPESNMPSTSSAAGVPIKKQYVQSNSGAIKKTIQPSQKKRKSKTTTIPKLQNVWTDQLKKILLHHENGARILIIMRGLPGSGKSHLAKKIIDSMFPVKNHENYSNYIFTTDDFFMVDNCYTFESSKLSNCHEQKVIKAINAMQGISPIIIDNTNIDVLEMKPYIIFGVKNGYIIEVVEPNTPWARNAQQLHEINVHGVSLDYIQNKLKDYKPGITGASLIKHFDIQYSPNMTPPVLRLLPPFVQVLPDNDRYIDNNKEPLDTNNVPSTSEYLSPSSNDDNIVCIYEEDDSETNDDDYMESCIESWMHEIHHNENQTALMIEEDAVLASELAFKCEEILEERNPPDVPNLNEAIDMDLAKRIYNKDVESWRDKISHDLADEKMREKLHDAFPEMTFDLLTELLVAHDNNLYQTVETILVSTERIDVLKEKKGAKKFVMQKEIERRKKDLLTKRQALTEVEWPLLPSFERVDMEMVQRYRKEAARHCRTRNICYQKAQNCMQRGMARAAKFYSDSASYHTLKYEQSNSWAAASLIQLHSSKHNNNVTLDLHYLRVAEAMESLDLFIDTHIQKLREMRDENIVRCHVLFIITGRGLHSHGKPRIKPAVKKRLTDRGLTFDEHNPGLLCTEVCADDKLSYQIA